MIYLELFLTFFKIGLFTFGGGYAMIPLVTEAAQGFGFSDSEIMNFIAVSESTPGPIAINMATFIGSSEGGILGSAVATLGVVLPSFIIILIIASVMKNLIKFEGVQAALGGVKPIVIALIVSTGATMLLSTLFGLATVHNGISVDTKSIIIFAIIVAVGFVYKKLTKKKISPIILILISAFLGIIFFGII